MNNNIKNRYAVIFEAVGFGGNALSIFIKNTTSSALSGELVKYIIYVLVIFMTLDQLKFASTIVTTTFLFIHRSEAEIQMAETMLSRLIGISLFRLSFLY